MDEILIYKWIYGALIFVTFGGVLPLAVKSFLKPDLSDKAVEASPNKGVSTRFVNVVDAVVLMLLLGVYALALPKGETENTESGTVPLESSPEIGFDLLLTNFVGQLFLIAIVCAIMFYRVNLIKQFGLSLKKYWKGLVWVPLILIVCWAFTGVIIGLGYFTYLKEVIGESPLQETVLILKESDDLKVVIMLAIVACVGAPLFEEVLFRGYLYPTVKAYLGKWGSMVFTAVLFGLIHFNLAGLPTLILMGFLLAFSYERTRSLWVPIIAHCAFNSTTVAVQVLSRYYPQLNVDF